MRTEAVLVAFPMHRVRQKPSRVVFGAFTERDQESRTVARLAAACAAVLCTLIAVASLITH